MTDPRIVAKPQSTDSEAAKQKSDPQKLTLQVPCLQFEVTLYRRVKDTFCSPISHFYSLLNLKTFQDKTFLSEIILGLYSNPKYMINEGGVNLQPHFIPFYGPFHRPIDIE